MAVTSKQHPILDLNNEALAQINGSTIKPTYDRSQLQAGIVCLLYTSPSPRDGLLSRMPSSA